MEISDISILLLYNISFDHAAYSSKDRERFINVCDKFLGKNYEKIVADQLYILLKMLSQHWQSQNLLNPNKVFIRLQSRVLGAIQSNQISLTTFAHIIRLYSDQGIT